MEKPKKDLTILLLVIPLLVAFTWQCVSANETLRERWKRKRLERQAQSSDTFGPKDYDFSLQHDGIERDYRVHLPRGYTSQGNKMPVVIYLHGGGGNVRSSYQDKLDQISDKYGFILASPSGTRVKRGIMSRAWNGGKWKGGQCCGDADDVGFISKMIEELKKQFNVDENRVYACGISNGGLMANRLACELSNKIAAIAVIAPAAVPQNCKPSRPIAMMDIHGTDDLCNPFDGSVPKGICGKSPYKRMSPHEVVDTWLEINECSRDYSIFYKKGNATCESYKCKNSTEVVFCKVKGMGHTWPSGSQYLSKRVVGPVSHDISSEQIYDFFKKHSLKQTK